MQYVSLWVMCMYVEIAHSVTPDCPPSPCPNVVQNPHRRFPSVRGGQVPQVPGFQKKLWDLHAGDLEP
jgi:hypothetical protein